MQAHGYSIMNPGEEESRAETVTASGRGDSMFIASMNLGQPIRPRFTSFKCGKLANAIGGCMLAAIILAGIIALLVMQERNPGQINRKVGPANDTHYDEYIAASCNMFIINTLMNSYKHIDQLKSTADNESYEGGSAMDLDSSNNDNESGSDEELTANTARKPTDEEKEEMAVLLCLMDKNGTFVATACMIGKKIIGFQCSFDVDDQLYIGYGKTKEDCEKLVSRKACVTMYGTKYANERNTSAVDDGDLRNTAIANWLFRIYGKSSPSTTLPPYLYV